MSYFIKSVIASALIMLTVIGTFSLTFDSEGEALTSSTDIVPTLNQVEIKREEQEKRLIALAVDSVCYGEAYTVKVAMCGLILNRIKSDGFPDSAAENIFVALLGKGTESIDLTADPSAEACRALRDAEYGLSPCPDALFFYTKNANDNYLALKTIKYKCGNFVFV